MRWLIDWLNRVISLRIGNISAMYDDNDGITWWRRCDELMTLWSHVLWRHRYRTIAPSLFFVVVAHALFAIKCCQMWIFIRLTETKEYWIILLGPKRLLSVLIVVKLSIMFRLHFFIFWYKHEKNRLMNAVTHTTERCYSRQYNVINSYVLVTFILIEPINIVDEMFK